MGFLINSAIILIYTFNSVENASILAVFSSLSFADHLVYRGYVSLLSRAGHSIVVMTPYPGHYGYPELERIIELGVYEESATFWDEYEKLMTDTTDYYLRMKDLNELAVKLAVAQLKSKPMTTLFNTQNVKFDLVITEAEIPLMFAIADKYQAPHIAITTSSGSISQYESKGVSAHPVLYPDVNALSYRNQSQWQIILETNRYINSRNEYYNKYVPLCEIAARKIFGLKRSLLELEYNIDMLFIASNPLLIGNRPTVPGITYVDRMHIKPGFNLPEDVKGLLDSAYNGAIYMSFGVIQKPEHLSVHLLQTLANAFRELPYLILWKISNTTMINVPDNVITNAWFPQQEVLAHPNTKAFITHGGARSLEEALFYEVPIVGFPIVTSRKVFMKEITIHGAGEILDLYYLDTDKVKEILNTVASDKSYKRSISLLRSRVVDPLISGPENALIWTNYILRNHGGRHLRSTAVGISLTKYYLLDIIFVLLILYLISAVCSFYIVRFAIRRTRARIFRKYELTGKFKAL